MKIILDEEIMNFLVRTLITIMLSTIIGLERELTGHKGSIKVNILVALGSCIFCSYEALMGITDNRISANIVTGVGFLCSGFIFKNGLNVNGLSTAATLWCSAGIGILTSRGFFVEGLLITLVLFGLNFLLSKTVTKIKPLKSFDDRKKDMNYNYNVVCLKKSAVNVKQVLSDNIYALKDISLEELITKSITEDKVRVVATVKLEEENAEKIELILKGVDSIHGVFSSGWSREYTQ